MDTQKTEFARISKGEIPTTLVSNVVTTNELTTVKSNIQTTGEKVKEIEKHGKNMKRELNRQERKIKGISKECRNNTETNVNLKKDINNLEITTNHLERNAVMKQEFNTSIDEIMTKIKNTTLLIIFTMYLLALIIIATMIFMG